MGTHPYTDDDLRAEAARQHNALTEDPDFMGVGEQMDGRYIGHKADDVTPPPGTPRWSDLDENRYDDAQRQIHDLVNGAADISQWAVDLGADGLEPLGDTVTAHTGNGPWFRLHFAVHPHMPEKVRRALAEAVGNEIAKHF
jgi:hypothetical protein